MKTTNKFAWIVFVILAVAVSLYPLTYLFIDQEVGILASKSEELLSNLIRNTGVYGHILFGD